MRSHGRDVRRLVHSHICKEYPSFQKFFIRKLWMFCSNSTSNGILSNKRLHSIINMWTMSHSVNLSYSQLFTFQNKRTSNAIHYAFFVLFILSVQFQQFRCNRFQSLDIHKKKREEKKTLFWINQLGNRHSYRQSLVILFFSLSFSFFVAHDF